MKTILIILLFFAYLTVCTISPSGAEPDPTSSANLQEETSTLTRASERPQSTKETVSSRELFPVVVDGKYGFIDRGGNIAIHLQFDRASGFSEGLAAVRGQREGSDQAKLLVKKKKTSKMWSFMACKHNFFVQKKYL